jgi:hypothetical protein
MKKRKHFNIDDVPDAIKRLNPHLFNEHGGKKFNPIQPISSKEPANASSKPPMAIETFLRDFPVIANAASNMADSKTRINSLNKTERRFYETVIPEVFKGQEYVIITQPTRLFELTGGGTYTPDFLVCTTDTVHVCEVKGGYRGPGWDQGIERYKRAAAQFNVLCIQFAMYTWDTKAKRWHVSKWADGNDQQKEY